jgi:hypothetical protein
MKTIVSLGVLLALTASDRAAAAANWASVRRTALRPPSFFTANQGQLPCLDQLGIRYYARTADCDVGFAPGRVFFNLKRGESAEVAPRHIARGVMFSLELGSGGSTPEALQPLSSYSNYFTGAASADWRTRVPHYATIRYREVFPGIDAVFFFGEDDGLTYEFLVAPGADPSQIELRYSDITQVKRLPQGGIVLCTAVGNVLDCRLRCLQVINEQPRVVAATYQITGPRSYGFTLLEPHDRTQTLIIDPTLHFSSYVGIGQFRSAAVDHAGNFYAAGGGGVDFPVTPGAYDTTHNSPDNSDVTVVKVAPNGTVVWSTFLGGSKEDYAYVCDVNRRGELYVSGRAGEGFPTTPGAYDPTFNGGAGNPVHTPADAFITKLSADGTRLIYSTYLGGSKNDIGRGIHVTPTGELVISANTGSEDFPTTPGVVLPKNPGGPSHGYVAKLSADGSELVFSTYLGTTNARNEFIFAVAEDKRGNYWFAGSTTGTDWGTLAMTPDAQQPSRGGGKNELYIGKLSADGTKLVYLSWFGGSSLEWIETEGLNDAQGNFYIAGQTLSKDFPTTPGAYQQVTRGFSDAFVAKFNVDGSLGACTLFGGESPKDESFWGPALDPKGNIYCAGLIRSDGLATTDAFQTKHQGEGDAFVAIFDPTMSRMLYGSYLGGTGHEKGRFVAVAPDGTAAYVVGHTSSPDYPVHKPPWSPEIGKFMAFVAKFDTADIARQPTSSE